MVKQDQAAVEALSLARAGIEGKDDRYLADTHRSAEGTRDGFDFESVAILEDLDEQGWILVRKSA